MAKRSKSAKPSPASEKEFRLLAEAMPQIVWVTRADGWTTYFNQQWVDYTGLTLEESYGHGWNKPFHPDDRQRAWDAWQNAVTNNDPYSLECRLRRADGVYRWWLIRGVPVLDKAGNILKWFGTCTDIDEIKQAETQVQIAADRERAAAAVKKERDLLQAVMDGAKNSHLVYLDRDFNFVRVNKTYAQSCGLRPEEMIGKNHFALYPNAENEAVFARVRDTGEPIEYHDRPFVFPDQPERGITYWDWTLTPVKESGGQVVGLIFSLYETTERKQAEAALRDSEEMYRAIGESIDYGVWVCDSAGRNTYASPSFLKLVGLTQDQCSNFGWGDVLHPEDAENTVAAWQECARTGSKWDVEHRFRGVDGQWHPILARGVPVRDDNGNIKFWAGINLDITNLKLAEESLRRSEERHRLLSETMLQGIVHQSADGKIITMNPAAERILGKSPEDLLGETSVDVEHHTIQEDGSPFLGSEHPAMMALQTGQSVRGVVMGVFNPREQAYRWISIDAVPVFRLGDDHPLEAYAVFADITERKKADEELQRARVELELRVKERTAELAQTLATLKKESADRLKAVQELHEKDRLFLQQSRLAAMGEIVNNIAHQWRQPLNVLGINIQSLSLFYDMGDFSKEFLDETIKNAMIVINHMSQTIDDFRNFFKPDKEKTDFCVNKAIQQAITLIEEIFKHDQVDIITYIHCEALINGYPNEFSQVILNILQNAHDVLVERKVKDGRITITLANENDRVVVTIADNGGGIPDEIIGQIFEPYFSTKGLQGTGIGLYMSKSIIEKNMGGSITVRNNAEGAEFRIEV